MKKKPLVIVSLAALVLGLVGAKLLHAQEKPTRQQYEYALLKWDGPDKIQVFYPDRFEFYRVFEKGNVLPKNAHDETSQCWQQSCAMISLYLSVSVGYSFMYASSC